MMAAMPPVRMNWEDVVSLQPKTSIIAAAAAHPRRIVFISFPRRSPLSSLGAGRKAGARGSRRGALSAVPEGHQDHGRDRRAEADHTERMAPVRAGRVARVHLLGD